ncbi:MAG: enoyl-CoA hydratase-related protein, partial [Pseudomonadota bacterium]|nr:enoyl-CoA hydratase-related protein [Pseudomonadota bacterium]
VFDDETFMEETEKIARKLAEGPSGQRFIRQVMWDSLDNNFETQLDVERQTQFQAGQTGDFFEGVNAFLDKRQAKFTGK